MPTYIFRCAECGDHERFFNMSAVPDVAACPACGSTSPRRPVGASLGIGPTPAMRALDASARSAYAPTVVSAPPPGLGRRRRTTSSNPLHARLPRP